jgi:hypothetical protein
MERAKHHGALALRASTDPLSRNRQSDLSRVRKSVCAAYSRSGETTHALQIDVKELCADDFFKGEVEEAHYRHEWTTGQPLILFLFALTLC